MKACWIAVFLVAALPLVREEATGGTAGQCGRLLKVRSVQVCSSFTSCLLLQVAEVPSFPAAFGLLLRVAPRCAA